MPIRPAFNHDRAVQKIKDATTVAKAIFKRKNYEEAVPYFREAYFIAKKMDDNGLELSCLNNFISSLRMIGAAGCSEAENYIDRALDLVAENSMLCDANSCINAYINVGSVWILKHEWLFAITMFNAAEDFIAKARATGLTVTAKMEGLATQCAAQARMGLAMDAPEQRDALTTEIDRRLRLVLALDLPNEV